MVTQLYKVNKNILQVAGTEDHREINHYSGTLVKPWESILGSVYHGSSSSCFQHPAVQDSINWPVCNLHVLYLQCHDLMRSD